MDTSKLQRLRQYVFSSTTSHLLSVKSGESQIWEDLTQYSQITSLDITRISGESQI